MKTLKGTLSILITAGICLWAVSSATANMKMKPNYSYTPLDEEALVLQPGWVASCHKNFLVENLGEGHADVKIRLGMEEVTQDRIYGYGKRIYNLREQLAFAKQLGKSVTMDDVALIRNQSENMPIRIHC